MISLELLTFKDGNALGNMLHLFGINGDVLVGYLGVGKKKWHLGKWKKSSPTIQKVEFSLNLGI